MASSFSVFGVVFYPYSLLMIAGAFACLGMFCLLTFRRHKGCTDENVFAVEMVIVSIAAGFPAALILDSLFKLGETGVFRLGSATFYGGLLCSVSLFPLLLLFRKKRMVSVYARLCDVAPGIPLGHCLGRIGCFLGGCCYGAPTDGVFGVVYPEGSLPYKHYGAAALHPTQLYEAFALILMFGVLMLFGKKRAIFLYFLLYSIVRFVLEFFRADDRGTIFGLPLSPAQIISVFLAAVAVGLELFRLIRFRRRKKE